MPGWRRFVPATLWSGANPPEATEFRPHTRQCALTARRTRPRDNQRLDDSMRIKNLFRTITRQKKSDRTSEIHPVAIQFGVPRSKPRYGRAGGDAASGHSYIFPARSKQYFESIR